MQLSKHLRVVITPDGAAVLDLRQGKMFQLNPTGAAIVGFLVQGYDEQAIIRELARSCRVEGPVVSADVGSFLASLGNHGWIE
jgi:hypothetical protein